MTDVDRDTARLVALLADRPFTAESLSDVDWDRLLTLALQHGIGPWLHARVKKGHVQLPAAAAEKLRRNYVASALRNILLFEELGEILRALRTTGIPVILLKGACLAEAVYGDSALRPMGDLDLLVKPTDLIEAVRTLRAMGYESDMPFDPVASQFGFQDMPAMRSARGVLVEVHWTLVTPLCNANIREKELEEIWSRAVPAILAGAETRMLSPTDLLLHLCMHMSVHHRFADISLRNLVDVAEVCRHYKSEIVWPEFVARANDWGVANGVRMALQLAAEWTDLAVPAGALAGLGGEPADDEAMRWVRHKVLNGAAAGLGSELSRLGGEARVVGKLAAIRDAVFLPRAMMARYYPVPADSWRVLAYYPVRWKDLWVRYRRALWKLATRDKEFVADARKEARLREYLGWR